MNRSSLIHHPNTLPTKLEGGDRGGSGRLNLKRLLHENPEQLLLLVHKKLLFFCSSTASNAGLRKWFCIRAATP